MMAHDVVIRGHNDGKKPMSRKTYYLWSNGGQTARDEDSSVPGTYTVTLT